MALRNQDLNALEERHLNALVTAAVPEERDVDYKRELPHTIACRPGCRQNCRQLL